MAMVLLTGNLIASLVASSIFCDVKILNKINIICRFMCNCKKLFHVGMTLVIANHL